MKYFTLLLSLNFCINGLAQVSQAEIDKMIEQAKRIANNQGSNKTSNNVKVPASKSPSTIISIPLKQPIQVPTKAQAKDKLLWYKGKKLNDSMLVTTSGMVVLFSKKQNRMVVQPAPKNDPFSKLVSNLAQSKQWTKAYVNKEAATKNAFMNYPLIQLTVDEFNDIDERFNAIVKNTIDLPLASTIIASNNKVKGGGEQTDEEDLDAMHKHLKELLQHPPEMIITAPPKKDFSLAYFCDSTAQKRYKRERQQWQEEFLAYETELMRTSLAIQRYMQLTGTISISKGEPGSPTLVEDLQTAMENSLARTDEKVQKLTGQNGKNIFMQDCVLTSILSNERQKQLLGMEEDKGAMATVVDLLESAEFEQYMTEQIAVKNYDVIFNFSVTLGRNRQTQLLAASGVSERLNALFLEIMQLNRFALTADVDFNMQYNDNEDKPMLKASSKISSKNKVYVSLARTGCKWTLHLSETDYENAKESQYYIPMVVKEGIKMVKKEEDKWVNYSYAGPKEMLMHFPVFKINFGDLKHQDTAIVQAMRYDPSLSLAGYANNVSQSYTIDLLGYLSHVFVSASKTEVAQDGLMNIANEMAKKFSSFTNFSAGNTALEQLKAKYLRIQQKLDFEKTISDASLLPKTIIFFNAFNQSTVLIDNETNTAHKDKEVEVTKGVIKLKVVHEPK